MKTEVREVTPDVAKQMLKRNGNNRKISDNHVGFLAKEMNNGNWLFDGSPIKFSEGGVLLDGQHRLNAVIKSDTSQKFLVVTGIDSAAFKVMDTGKNRNTADIMSVEGIKYPSDTAAAARIIIKMKKGRASVGGVDKPSNTEVLDFYYANLEIGRFIKESQILYNEFSKVTPLSTIAAFKFMMAERSITHSEEFWNKLCTGIGLEDGDPIKFLRKKLLTDKINRASLPAAEKNAIIIKTWNAFRRGNTLKRTVAWKKGEKFPKLM